MISYRCVGEQAQIACQTYCSVFSYSILSVEVRKLLEQCRILGKVQFKGSFLTEKHVMNLSEAMQELPPKH